MWLRNHSSNTCHSAAADIQLGSDARATLTPPAVATKQRAPREDFVSLPSEVNPRCAQTIGNIRTAEQRSRSELKLGFAIGTALLDKSSLKIYECPFVCCDTAASICIRFARRSSGGQGRVQMIVVDFCNATVPEVSCRMWTLSLWSDARCSLRTAVVPAVNAAVEQFFGADLAKNDAGLSASPSIREGLRPRQLASAATAIELSAKTIITRAGIATHKGARSADVHRKPVAPKLHEAHKAQHKPLAQQQKRIAVDLVEYARQQQTRVRRVRPNTPEPTQDFQSVALCNSIAEAAHPVSNAPTSTSSSATTASSSSITDASLVAQFLASPAARRLILHTAAGSEFIINK